MKDLGSKLELATNVTILIVAALIWPALTLAQSDPIASTMHDRDYRNPFFHLSWKAPFPSSEAERLRIGDQRVVERIRQANRKDDVLVRSEKQDFFSSNPNQIGCCSSWGSRNGEPGGTAFAEPGQYRVIIANVADKAEPCDVLSRRMPPPGKQADVQTDILAEPTSSSIGGQFFCSAEWRLKGREKYQTVYARDYVTIRKGYALIFQFRADTPRELRSVARSMASLRFEPM